MPWRTESCGIPKRRFVTTDWVVGETVNLLVAHRRIHLPGWFLQSINQATGLHFVHGRSDLLGAARDLFLRYEEHGFPFTDCTTFSVIKEIRTTNAPTPERHFRIMGFNSLLVD